MANNISRSIKILTEYGDPTVGNAASDVLALTPDAMLACRERSIPYFTTEDFYCYKRFREDVGILQRAADELFLKLDSLVKMETSFSCSYTANSYWFQILFDDLLYMTRVSAAIRERYDTVEIMGRSRPNGPFKLDSDISDCRIIMRFVGLENKIRMFFSVFSGKVSWIDLPSSDEPLHTPKPLYLRNYFRRAGRMMLALKELMRSRLLPASRGTVFVVQDGYEIGFLKKVLTELNFLDISRELSSTIDISGNNASFAPDVREEISAFSRKFFPVFEDELIRFFIIYYDRILSRMAGLKTVVTALIEKHKPTAFMYAIGANTAFEEMCASLANQHGIPVYYFQHGGFDSILYNDPYHKYLEYNQRVKKTRVLCSEVERRLCEERFANSEGAALGSMALYNLSRKAPRARGSKKVLYCPAIFSFFAYKQLLYTVPDFEVLNVNSDIIKTAHEQGLALDVKIHPGQDMFQRAYFRRLITNCGTDARVIGGIPADEIVGNYGLLILDYIATMMVPVGFIHRMPVILYIKDRSVLDNRTVCDLDTRCYIVEDKKELSRLLRLFERGELESKYSEDIIKKYAFPDMKEDPARSIASYIRKRGIMTAGVREGLL